MSSNFVSNLKTGITESQYSRIRFDMSEWENISANMVVFAFVMTGFAQILDGVDSKSHKGECTWRWLQRHDTIKRIGDMNEVKTTKIQSMLDSVDKGHEKQ